MMSSKLGNQGAASGSLLSALAGEIRQWGQKDLIARIPDLWDLAEERGGPDGQRLTWIFPEGTVALSSTGTDCALDCAHCGGHHLARMRPVSETGVRVPAADSWLLSGGCDAQGRVPMPDSATLERLAGLAPINAHVGLIDEDEAAAIARFASRVSFDMVGDRDTIERILGLSAEPDDYWATYQSLKQHVVTVPHIILGLDGGQFRGEYDLVERLASDPPSVLVLLIFWPTPGTRLAQADPPPLADVLEFLMTARRRLPSTRLHLGCMRPPGRYRMMADVLAAASGVDLIVQPTSRVRALAQAAGAQVAWGDQCCAFYDADPVASVRFTSERLCQEVSASGHSCSLR